MNLMHFFRNAVYEDFFPANTTFCESREDGEQTYVCRVSIRAFRHLSQVVKGAPAGIPSAMAQFLFDP